ncbi:bacteriocin-like protein [Mediterraneibacter sp. gm002]
MKNLQKLSREQVVF